MSRPFHVLSVPMLCVFHITHKSRPYMLQKDTNCFVEVFNRTRSSVEIYVFPPVYWHSAAFNGFVFGISWWSFWIFTFWVLMYLFFVFLLSWLFFILNRQKSSTCASFCLTCVQKAPPSQVHVLPFVLVKFLFPVDYCFWICFLESLDLLGSLPYFSKFSVSCSTWELAASGPNPQAFSGFYYKPDT